MKEGYLILVRERKRLISAWEATAVEAVLAARAEIKSMGPKELRGS